MKIITNGFFINSFVAFPAIVVAKFVLPGANIYILLLRNVRYIEIKTHSDAG